MKKKFKPFYSIVLLIAVMSATQSYALELYINDKKEEKEIDDKNTNVQSQYEFKYPDVESAVHNKLEEELAERKQIAAEETKEPFQERIAAEETKEPFQEQIAAEETKESDLDSDSDLDSESDSDENLATEQEIRNKIAKIDAGINKKNEKIIKLNEKMKSSPGKRLQDRISARHIANHQAMKKKEELQQELNRVMKQGQEPAQPLGNAIPIKKERTIRGKIASVFKKSMRAVGGAVTNTGSTVISTAGQAIGNAAVTAAPFVQAAGFATIRTAGTVGTALAGAVQTATTQAASRLGFGGTPQ